jgi:hypothetical protein
VPELWTLGGIAHFMQHQNLDTAWWTGVIFGSLFWGCICGLLPLYEGKRIGRSWLGVAGFFTCLVSGGFFGLFLTLPVMILFTIVILILGRPESKQSLPPNTALEPL